MLLRLVIISFILMSLVNDSAVLLQAFQGMGQVRQVQKWQLALKEKSADFKSPDLGSSVYALINYNHRLLLTTTTDFDTNYFLFFLCSHS